MILTNKKVKGLDFYNKIGYYNHKDKNSRKDLFMAKENNNTKQGFTIIEVVLVLAIAGLIFLMVFVALPALQRSQRDTARRNDMSRVDTSLVQYQTNNSSATENLPAGPSLYIPSKTSDKISDGSSQGNTAAKDFIQRYMNPGTDSTTNTFEDPDGTLYSMYITENYANNSITASKGDAKLTAVTGGYTVGSEFDKHIIYVVPGGMCDGEIVKPSTKRHFAVLYRLEGAGVYCIDDQ